MTGEVHVREAGAAGRPTAAWSALPRALHDRGGKSRRHEWRRNMLQVTPECHGQIRRPDETPLADRHPGLAFPVPVAGEIWSRIEP